MMRSPCSAASTSTSAGSLSAAVPRIARCAAHGEHRLDVLRLAEATADLYLDVDRLADPLDVLDVHRRALARAVEVDDVERPRALVDPAPSGLARVGVERGLALVVALDQPHRAPVADVDRRVEDHTATTGLQTAAKFASRRRPAALDFSGWNCTP